MLAIVEVDARHAAKGKKAAEQEGKTPPPQPVAALRKHRQPTPDHPPYCWMIGEAIDALGEDGGSAEDSISAFICARYPGVPAAHDRLLRHYLAKHVAEGFFVLNAHGRYARSPEESAAVEFPVEPSAVVSSEAACVGSLVTQAKRGRGRPRKDGSLPGSPSGKKGGSGAQYATPKRRGQRRDAAPLAADEGSVPASSVSIANNKDGSQATSSTPRRRRRLRKLALGATDGSGAALFTDKDGGDAPSITDKEHGRSRERALMIVHDGAATTSARDKVCGEAPPTTPKDHDPCELALVTATDVFALTPAMDKKDGGAAPSFSLALVANHDGVSTTSTDPEHSSQPCELALVSADDGSVPALVADKKDDGEAPYATYKRRRQPPRKVAPVAIAAHGSAPASTAGEKAGGKALSATPKGRRRQRQKPALLATGDLSAPTVAGKKAGSMVSFATPKLTPVTAGGGSTTASVADKDSNVDGVATKPHGRPRKLYPPTADEIPDDPLFCLLALPACMPAAANA
ncbi:uncharacterized protein LOC133925571 [Phragmites australis]|uniref:uncharacterized protein LOC133925571 n=1 Tax=Phragmites australis TaxID=29695 RepID=UPI002D7682B7|nr:uncharacterized protein LOC133925571 [Phragmites australis]